MLKKLLKVCVAIKLLTVFNSVVHLYAGSGDLLSANFNPKWHLAEMHRFTSFSELKRGLVQLRHELDNSEEAPVFFMRDNLLTFLQSYDTLSGILSNTTDRP